MHWVMNKVLGPVRFPCNYSINDSFREENPVKAVGCTQGPIRLYDLRETPQMNHAPSLPPPHLLPLITLSTAFSLALALPRASLAGSLGQAGPLELQPFPSQCRCRSLKGIC